MIEFFKDIKVDWLGKRKMFLAISGSVMLFGLISLVAKRGFEYGVDFKGGTIVQVRFKEKPKIETIRQWLKVGDDLKRQAVFATLYALGGILIYIAFRFEWIYGAAAVFAVFHDTLVTLGLFSIFHRPINLTVIAAMLTLVGYSVNDTIVVF